MVEQVVVRALRLAGLADEPRVRRILSEHAQGVLARWNMEVPEEQRDLLKQALACFTLAEALPALHTFYINDAPRLAKQYAETDMVFLSPEEVKAQVEHYRQLGEEIIFRLKGGSFRVETT